MSSKEPPTTSECKLVGEKEIKSYSKFKCEKSEPEMTEMFWNWNCSKSPKSNFSIAIVSGMKQKCEKALEDFRARH